MGWEYPTRKWPSRANGDHEKPGEHIPDTLELELGKAVGATNDVHGRENGDKLKTTRGDEKTKTTKKQYEIIPQQKKDNQEPTLNRQI